MNTANRLTQLAAILLCINSATLAAEDERPSVAADGTITVPNTTVPVSSYLSDQAKAAVIKRLTAGRDLSSEGSVEADRAKGDARAKKILDAWLQVLPSNIEDTQIDGVHVHIVTPIGGVDARNRHRVLINAHSGGFMYGGTYGGQIEAVPMAGYGRVKVIAVDYRMAPEHVYPAASEDMERVYRHVLRTTPAENVGLYGCSAGGTLAAQMVPWLEARGLPKPGAIGLFCSGAAKGFWYGGDSQVTAPVLNGYPAVGSNSSAAAESEAPRDYFHGIDQNTPLITPGEFPETLAKFPPTLVVTGTRDISMSNAIVTHGRMLSAGVRAELFVQEGLGHGDFAMLPGIPESETAHRIMWAFFDRHLSQR